MKKLVVIWLLLFFTIIGNTQWYHSQYNVSNISELNQDQLNLALSESLKTIKAAENFAGIGVVVGITGTIILIDDRNKRMSNTGILGNLPTEETGLGALILAGGIITEVISITAWMTRSDRKKDIEIELVKFNPKGSASINGIGLIINF
jgi:hypothetical protein